MSTDPTSGVDSDELIAAIPGLLRYARTMTNDAALSEDLVQSTLLRALEKGGYRGESGVATWLHRILHNLFIDHVRADRERPDEDIWQLAETKWRDPAFTVDADRVVERIATGEAIRDALVRVPANYRSAIVLHDMEGLTVPEVARIQQVGLSAAKQRVSRGRLLLVNALSTANERRVALKGIPLNCWDARKQVSDYLDGELPGNAARLLEAHLATCPTCPPLYSCIVASREAVSSLRDTDNVIPDVLAHRLRSLTGPASGNTP